LKERVFIAKVLFGNELPFLVEGLNDLVKLTINDKHRLITFDIKDLYVNISLKKPLTSQEHNS